MSWGKQKNTKLFLFKVKKADKDGNESVLTIYLTK